MISFIYKVVFTLESILVKFDQILLLLAFSVKICLFGPISNLVTLYDFIVKFYVKLISFSSQYINQFLCENQSVLK